MRRPGPHARARRSHTLSTRRACCFSTSARSRAPPRLAARRARPSTTRAATAAESACARRATAPQIAAAGASPARRVRRLCDAPHARRCCAPQPAKRRGRLLLHRLQGARLLRAPGRGARAAEAPRGATLTAPRRLLPRRPPRPRWLRWGPPTALCRPTRAPPAEAVAAARRREEARGARSATRRAWPSGRACCLSPPGASLSRSRRPAAAGCGSAPAPRRAREALRAASRGAGAAAALHASTPAHRPDAPARSGRPSPVTPAASVARPLSRRKGMPRRSPDF
jgi:hypothetical protein